MVNHEGSREREEEPVNEPAVSDEPFEYKPPYQVPHRNDNKDLGPNENIRGIAKINNTNIEQREESERSWTPPDVDFAGDKYRRPIDRVVPPKYDEPYRGDTRNSRGSNRDFIFSGSRAPLPRESAGRMEYPEPEPFRRPSKTGKIKKKDSNVDDIINRVDSKPVKIGGKRDSYSSPSKGKAELIIL